MKSVLIKGKTKRYLYRPTRILHAQPSDTYGTYQKSEIDIVERHYSFIVPWQMEEHVEKE